MFSKIINNRKVFYLYEIDKNTIKEYYKMKNKNDFHFLESEKRDFIEKALNEIKNNIKDDCFDIVIYPETKNECFLEIIKELGLQNFEIKKNDNVKVIEELKNIKLMKAERLKLEKSISEMDHIKIGLIASNQREKVAKILFKTDAEIMNKKILYLDDSIFTGSTFKAFDKYFKIDKAIVLFSNTD